MNQGNKKIMSLFVAVFFLLGLMLCSASAEAAGVTLKGWKDISGNNPSDVDGSLAHAGTYEYVLFGRYPQLQTEATPVQPILWQVLGIDDGKALLFSDKNLNAMAFRPENYTGGVQNSGLRWDNNYANSKVRDFLVGSNANGMSGGIFNDAAGYFSASEKSIVSAKTFSTVNGNGANAIETTNPLFLLSPTEELSNINYGFNSKWNDYIDNTSANDVNRVARNTVYAINKGADDSSGIGVYWSRSPYSGFTYGAWYEYGDGSLGAVDVDIPIIAVRPACFINLQSVVFKSDSVSSGLSDSVLGFAPSGAAGENSNPFLLYCATEYRKPQKAAVTGSLIEVSFDKYAAHVWADASDDEKLGKKFTVTMNGTPVDIGSADVQNGKALLSPDVALDTNDTVVVTYKAYTASDTDGIGFPATNTVLAGFVAPPTPSGSDPTPPAPSNNTTPTSVSTTGDGTYLITVPNGTDISNLPVDVTPPAKGTVSPDMPVSNDFTKGPLTVTVTAENGSKKDYTIKVQIEEPEGPTEKVLFTINVADCEIVVTQNADGTYAVKIRIPFAQSSNPALLDTVRMIASSLGLSDISYVWIDTQGKETPITRMASAPYLEIRGTAANLDAIKNGAITSIQYTLKGDNAQYVQTFPGGGLKVASMPGYPSPEPTPSGSSSSGCDAGAAGLLALAFCCAHIAKRKF